MSVRRLAGVPRLQETDCERAAHMPAVERPSMRFTCAAIATCALMLASSFARAQTATTDDANALPTAAVLATTKASTSDAGLDLVVHAALEKLGVVKIVAQPALDLGAMQLALDCVEETPQCLRAVAEQSHGQILVAPAVQHSGQELVVTLLYFDARGEGEVRHVVRHQQGSELSPETLDAVPDMLRQLFQIPQPAETPDATPNQTPVDEQSPSAAPKRGVPVGPLIVAGAGVLLVAGGVVSGLMMENDQDAFTALKVRNKDEKTAADKTASRGKTEATVANVLYGIGAAAIAAGVVWMALELTHRDAEKPTQTALVPVLGHGQLGLALVHRGAAL